ncbi:MAG: IS982 family transposase, partial [Lactobacillus sp.]
VGYVGKKLKTSFRALGYNLWTPYRSNMKGAKQHNKRQLKALRRTIESRFSILAQQFGIETNLTRRLFGFQLKIELTILVYNLGFFDFMTN